MFTAEDAKRAGFADAALIDTAQIEFDASFLDYCRENLCGKYGINHTCPPECGTPEVMRDRILKYTRALVVRSHWMIDYHDAAAVKSAKKDHNARMKRLIGDVPCLMAGASCCTLCAQCSDPCPHPDKRWSCMSAYCINVAKIAETCGMEYFAADGGVSFFGLIAF